MDAAAGLATAGTTTGCAFSFTAGLAASATAGLVFSFATGLIAADTSIFGASTLSVDTVVSALTTGVTLVSGFIACTGVVTLF